MQPGQATICGLRLFQESSQATLLSLEMLLTTCQLLAKLHLPCSLSTTQLQPSWEDLQLRLWLVLYRSRLMSFLQPSEQAVWIVTMHHAPQVKVYCHPHWKSWGAGDRSTGQL